MRQKVLAGLSIAVLAASVALSPSGASAASCVSEKSFGKVKNGMTISQVKKIWGTNGKRDAYSKVGSSSAEVRSYKACSQFGAVAVSFMDGRVAAKSGVF